MTSNLKPTQVVVIDDNHTTIELIKTVLEPKKFVILGVESDNEGVNAGLQFNPDVIIIDTLAPHKNILDICKDIRSRSHVPILVLSAVNKTGTLERTLNAGADEYLFKPVPVNILIAHINTLARRFQAEKKAGYRLSGKAPLHSKTY